MAPKDKTDGDKLKKLADFRQRLEKRIEEISAELEGLLVLLEFADATLLEKGFKRAEAANPSVSESMPSTSISKPPIKVAVPPVVEYESVVPLKTVTGDLLANLYSGKNSLRIILAEDKEFNVNTPPFLQFLVERVFVKMQDKDRQAAASGELEPDKMFSFKIVQDDNILREVLVENVSEDRMRELKSTIRWTLEKMFEKPKPPDV
jgi:hypothetical protein